MTVLSQSDETIGNIAAQWVVQCHGDSLNEPDLDALNTWLEADPSHAMAYSQALSLWYEVSPEPSQIDEDVLFNQLQGQLISFEAHALKTTPKSKPSLNKTRYLYASAVAACLMVCVSIYSLYRLNSASQTDSLYSTQKGQSQTITLADTSVLSLNADTRVRVKLASGERQLILEKGEIAINVAHDPAHPFSVRSDNILIQDIGTQFNVKKYADHVKIDVAQGQVSISADQSDKRAHLSMGQQAVVENRGAKINISQIEPKDVFAWRTGHVIYHQERLVDVVDDLNRYFDTPIHLDDKARNLKLTAVLTLDNEPAVIQRLQVYLPIQAHTHEKEINLRLSDQPNGLGHSRTP